MSATAVVFNDQGLPRYTMWQHDLQGYVEKMAGIGEVAGIVGLDPMDHNFENYYHDGTIVRPRPPIVAIFDKESARAGGGDAIVVRLSVKPVTMTLRVVGPRDRLDLISAEVDDPDVELVFDTPGLVEVEFSKWPYLPHRRTVRVDP